MDYVANWNSVMLQSTVSVFAVDLHQDVTGSCAGPVKCVLCCDAAQDGQVPPAGEADLEVVDLVAPQCYVYV